jgi:transcriptional regulator with XRE-family HTH domain
MDLREVFAANLRRLRHARGLSQDDLAYEARVSRSYLSQLEKGAFYASLKIVGRLASVLDVEPAELLQIPAGAASDGNAPTLEHASSSVPRQTTPRRPGASPVYTEEDYSAIAEAVNEPVERVLTFAGALDEQALWFRLESAQRSRTAGKAPRGSTDRTQDSPDRELPPRPTPTAMRNKLRSIESAGNRLLQTLGIGRREDAPDGPEDWDVLDALAGALRNDEDLVINASGRISELIEVVVEALNSAALLERAAAQATVEQARLGRLIVPPGHQGNQPLNNWIAEMARIYRDLTGNDPGTSVGSAGRSNEGEAGGPFIRFLQAASRPLGVKQSPSAWRRRVRSTLPSLK